MAWTGILHRNRTRKGWRESLRMPLWVVEDFERHYVCELVELSRAGFRLRASHKLPRKKELLLRVFSGHAEEELGAHGFARKGLMVDIPGEVLWVRKYGVGPFHVFAGGRISPEGQEGWAAMCRGLLHGPGTELADQDEHRSHARYVVQERLVGQEMTIRDVSEGGVGLLTRHPVEPNAWMELVLEGDDFALRCQGRVVRCQEILQGQGFIVGLAFEKLGRVRRDRLVRYVAGLLEKGARPAAGGVLAR